MASPFTWRITDGYIAFKLVDTAAVGYLPSWQAPAGKTSETATLTDYEAGSESWRCQVTSGMLTPTADTTTTPVTSTFCELGHEEPTPLKSRWTLDIEMFQDPQVPSASPAMGLSEYTYRHDAQEVYFLLGLNGSDDPPRAVGRIFMSPTAFGGVAQTPLTATASWPCKVTPDIAYGVTFVAA